MWLIFFLPLFFFFFGFAIKDFLFTGLRHRKTDLILSFRWKVSNVIVPKLSSSARHMASRIHHKQQISAHIIKSEVGEVVPTVSTSLSWNICTSGYF
jgi:hypothetical protein